MTQDADSVELTVVPWVGHRETGQEQQLRALYVIAADGSKSSIREMRKRGQLPSASLGG